MVRYRAGKISEFCYKYDWNRMINEVGTVLIAVGLGLYYFENDKVNGLFSGDKPYVTIGLVVIGVCAVLKLAIYSSLFDANSLKGGGAHKKTHKGVDINGIAQEIVTAALGFILGIFTTPAVKNAFVFQQTEYPNPTLGVGLAVLCLFLKIALYAEAINFNTRHASGVWQPKKFRPFLAKRDWNKAFQEFSSITIGIATGLYMYESRLVFLPEQWGQSFFSAIGLGEWFSKTMSNLRAEALSAFGGKNKQIDWVPDILNNEATRPYVIAGAILLGVCIVLKILLYSSLWDANRLRDSLLSQRAKHYHYGIDYNGIVEEVVTFLLTTLFGIVTTPVLRNAVGQNKESYYGQYLFIGLMVVLLIAKFCLMTGALEFGRSKARTRTSR
jgi:uncharacterized membrane protein